MENYLASLVNFDNAFEMKILGFDWKCFDFYEETIVGVHERLDPRICHSQRAKPVNWNDESDDESVLTSAPTIQMGVVWLLDEYKLFIQVEPYWSEDGRQFLAKILKINDGCATLLKTVMVNDTVESAYQNAMSYIFKNIL